jgi:hypothetical protein
VSDGAPTMLNASPTRSRHHRFSPSRPPRLAERLLGATGLTSYPSGYVGIAVGWSVFRPPQSGVFADFARSAHSPNTCSAFAFRLC